VPPLPLSGASARGFVRHLRHRRGPGTGGLRHCLPRRDGGDQAPGGAEEALAAGLINIDVWDLSWHLFKLARKDDCPCCVERRFPFLEVAASSHTTSLCGRSAVQVTPARAGSLDLEQLAARLRPVGEVTLNPFLLKLRVDGYLLTIFRDARAIVQGTTDETVARNLYARYVGV
jgi:molybdopterin-synthase adenylyltransferase